MAGEATATNGFDLCPVGDRHADPGSERRLVWERSQEAWEEVVLSACKGVGLLPERARQIGAPGDINDQMLRRIRDSTVVVADVTGANPNVTCTSLGFVTAGLSSRFNLESLGVFPLTLRCNHWNVT